MGSERKKKKKKKWSDLMGSAYCVSDSAIYPEVSRLAIE